MFSISGVIRPSNTCAQKLVMGRSETDALDGLGQIFWTVWDSLKRFEFDLGAYAFDDLGRFGTDTLGSL